MTDKKQETDGLTQEQKDAQAAAQREEMIKKSEVYKEGDPLGGAGKKPVFQRMVKEFGQVSYTSAPGKGLPLYPQEGEDSDEDEEEEELDENGEPKPKKKKPGKKKKKDKYGKGQTGKGESVDVQNLYTEDKTKIDLINNLNSIKLLQISEQFEMMPEEAVDIEQFVKIMGEVLKDTVLSEREEFKTDLVDLFFRINKENDDTIEFQDITTYLIDHEIAFDAELGTTGGINASNSSGLNMEYYESSIQDPTVHNNYIEKIHYFQQIDKVILYEQNMKIMRIYNGSTLALEKDLPCPGVILAIEYIPDKNAICVSLSDRTFMFYDASSASYKQIRKFDLPCTQKCLCYVQRKRALFSAGTEGATFAWLIDKIFKNEYFEDLNDKGNQKPEMEYQNFTTENTPWFLGSIASCIVDLENIEQIATGAYTMRIELWELRNDSNQELPAIDLEERGSIAGKTNASQVSKAKKKGSSTAGGKSNKGATVDIGDDVAKEATKKLVGHKRAIREIAYSSDYKILVSVGFDFQVFVWNPYWENYIIKLDGHESPLVGVNCPKGLECFITCDTKGMINVWNIKDYSQMQTLHVSNVNTVTSMRVVPKHRRIVVGSRVFKVFEYKKPFNSDTSDDHPINCAIFSRKRFEFYIAGENSINVWDAKEGKPTRCFKNCFEHDITYMALDKEHRKLIVGSHSGKIKVFDIISGVMINELHGHNEENGEISFIGYGDEDLTIITTAWDKTVKIHIDDRDEQKKGNPELNVLRGKEMCHRKDIVSGDYSHNLGLIATGGRDNAVRIWRYEPFKNEDEIFAHEDEVTKVKFLKPFPLLMSADSTGVMYIWLIRPHPDFKCVVRWENKASMKEENTISAVDSYYNEKTGEFLLLLGDEKGFVKIQDISFIIEKYDLKPVDVVTDDTTRTPHKPSKPSGGGLFKYIKDNDDEDANSEIEHSRPKYVPDIDDGKIKQIFELEAHSDAIKAVQFISDTDVPLVFTAGLDRLAKIHDLDKNLRGTLYQGYMLKQNYKWDFPLTNYTEMTEIRKEEQEVILTGIRNERNDQTDYRRQREQAIEKYGNMQSSLGFVWGRDDLVHISQTGWNQGGNMGQTGMTQHGKPASYMMSKHGDTSGQMSQSIYDDTGRGAQSLKVHRLLDKARRVIQREAKKEKQAMDKSGKKSTFANAGASIVGGYQTQSSYNRTGFSHQNMSEEERAKMMAKKIGPFSFDIDDDIDTEVLTNEQVYDDLKELEDILDQGQDMNAQISAKSLGKSKKKR